MEILFWLIRLVGNGLVTIDTLSGDVGLNARVLSHAWVKVNSGVFSGGDVRDFSLVSYDGLLSSFFL